MHFIFNTKVRDLSRTILNEKRKSWAAGQSISKCTQSLTEGIAALDTTAEVLDFSYEGMTLIAESSILGTAYFLASYDAYWDEFYRPVPGDVYLSLKEVLTSLKKRGYYVASQWIDAIERLSAESNINTKADDFRVKGEEYVSLLEKKWKEE